MGLCVEPHGRKLEWEATPQPNLCGPHVQLRRPQVMIIEMIVNHWGCFAVDDADSVPWFTNSVYSDELIRFVIGKPLELNLHACALWQGLLKTAFLLI